MMAALASAMPPLQARMVAISSSTMSVAFFRPSRMWARSLAFFRSYWVRRRDDLVLELDVLLDHLLQGQDLGHLVVDGQHDDAHGILQLGVLVQLVQHHLGVGVLADVDDDAHALAVGLIVQVADALDALVLDEVRDVLNEARLVDHIGDLGDDDLGAAVLLLLNGGAAAQGDLAAAGGVGGADAAAAHDDAGSGEVRALDILHQAGQVDVRVVDIGAHSRQ